MADLAVAAVTFVVVTVSDDRNHPDALYHYTDAFGLMGILQPSGWPYEKARTPTRCSAEQPSYSLRTFAT